MTQHIINFLTERKTTWLKTKLKSSPDESTKTLLEQEAENKFSLATWLPDAAKRASQLSMVSHPGKFSHPSAKTSTVIAKCEQANDGYLRSGNVNYELDVFGNAAAMDAHKFLSLQIDDSRTVLEHLEEDSDAIKTLFNIPTADYAVLKEGLISVKKIDAVSKTDHMVKQVYFPTDGSYHLLSLLTPSGLLTEVKNRIDAIRYSEETKTAKELRKKNEHHSTGYADLFDLTVTAYGGTQPQNVSVLNSRNAGRAYLLACKPPSIKQRQIPLPTKDFFRNSLRFYYFKESFKTMTTLSQCPLNNFKIRLSMKNIIKFIIDLVLEQAFNVREAIAPGWSNTEHYSSLPLSQKIWLDDFYLDKRENEDEWFKDISVEMARWIIRGYEYSLKKENIKLGHTELNEIKKLTEEAVSKDEEFFK